MNRNARELVLPVGANDASPLLYPRLSPSTTSSEPSLSSSTDNADRNNDDELGGSKPNIVGVVSQVKLNDYCRKFHGSYSAISSLKSSQSVSTP